jgi:hypothetical protein
MTPQDQNGPAGPERSHASSSANLLAFVCGPLATGATYELYSEADYSFNAKGLDSQAAEPRFPRPDLRQRHQDRGESWPR